MAFIVEITSRSGRVMERHRFDGAQLRIGRGYDNRLILSDPYVSVHHLYIESINGQWRVCPAETGASYTVNGRRAETAPVDINSGATLVLGRTHLRIYAPDHPVEPMLVFDRVEQIFASLATPTGVVWSVVAFTAILLGDLYLRSWTPIETASLIQEMVANFGLSIAWAAFWSVVGRISRGEPRFFHHWLVAVIAVCLGVFGEYLIDVIAFNTASVDARDVLSRLLDGLCLAFALTLNLRFSLRQSTFARHAWAQGFAWALIGYGILSSMQFETFFAGAPQYEGTVMSEVWRIAPSVPADTFIEGNADLYRFPEEPDEE